MPACCHDGTVQTLSEITRATLAVTMTAFASSSDLHERSRLLSLITLTVAPAVRLDRSLTLMHDYHRGLRMFDSGRCRLHLFGKANAHKALVDRVAR